MRRASVGAFLALALAVMGCSSSAAPSAASPRAKPQPPPAGSAVATFAGGCFWCMEPPFDAIAGVYSTTSGYAGGKELDPTYQEVSRGGTGHAESLQVVYDPKKVTYEKLLDVFWRNIDPLAKDRQFCDTGSQYRSVIFFHDADQRRLAEESKQKLEKSGRLKGTIVTEILPVNTFYPAEEYHQDFYKREPDRYHSYRSGCGRDKRLKELWGEEAGAHK